MAVSLASHLPAAAHTYRVGAARDLRYASLNLPVTRMFLMAAGIWFQSLSVG
jgi:hypothetical protein